jgi:hypothetical protein
LPTAADELAVAIDGDRLLASIERIRLIRGGGYRFVLPIDSRISWLASSMSCTWPVSFHQPCTMCGSTRMPRSTSVWIASVISSSPRQDGSIERAASKIEALNM